MKVVTLKGGLLRVAVDLHYPLPHDSQAANYLGFVSISLGSCLTMILTLSVSLVTGTSGGDLEANLQHHRVN